MFIDNLIISQSIQKKMYFIAPKIANIAVL